MNKTKRTLSKLFALVLMVCVVFSLAIIVSSAADEATLVATFELGADKDPSAIHGDGTSATTYTEEDGEYTLSITSGVKMYTGANDEQGNSCIKFGTSSAIGSMQFTVPDEVVTVKLYVAKYKAKTSKVTVNGATTTLTVSSNDGNYDVITVDTSSTKTVSFTTVSGAVRAMLNTVEFYAVADSSCEHVNQTTTVNEATCTVAGSTVVTCDDCGSTLSSTPIEATGHVNTTVTNTVAATCTENGSITKTCACGEEIVEVVAATGHIFENKVCTVCGDKSANQVVLNVNSLGVPSQSYVDGNGNVDGISFEFKQIGNYGNGIQVKGDRYSTIWNTAAFGNGIKKIILVHNSAKNTYNNTDSDTFTFGNEAGEAAYTYKLSTVSGVKTYEITPDKDTYTFFKYERINTYACYWDSITIVLEEPKFESASVTLGDDLGMQYKVFVPTGTPSMTFEFDGETYTVDTYTDNGNGIYTFAFDGIGPHQMANVINATLLVDGEAVASFNDYSVETNLKAIKADDTENTALTALVDNLLIYGSAAEKYVGKTENLVDVTGLVASEATPEGTAAPENNTNADAYIVGAGVRFDSVNKIFVKVYLADAANTVVTVNGEAVTELIDLGNGYYKFYTEGIEATDFDTDVEVVVGDAKLAYCVNDYAAAMQSSEKSAELALALYRYGVTAEAYAAMV